MWNRDSPVSVVSLHWCPDVIDHCGLVSGGLRPELLLGRRANNVIIPLDLTQLFCPSFMLAACPPFCFTTDVVGCWGGGDPLESLQSRCIHTQLHWSSGPPVSFPSWGTRVPSPGGTYVKPEFSCKRWLATTLWKRGESRNTVRTVMLLYTKFFSYRTVQCFHSCQVPARSLGQSDQKVRPLVKKLGRTHP
jgi:hypothetical protein